jgi:TolB-like protein/Flp pilus assembly protein TadD
MSLFAEIKRRKVFQVTAVYLVVSWLIMQVVDVVNAPLNLPDWFDTATIVALAIGLPIALILAWAFDLTPDGVVRDMGSIRAVQTHGQRIEYVLIGLLIVAMLWVIYRVEFDPVQPIEQASNSAAQEAKDRQGDSTALPNSIAILICDNLSPDPDNAFFAQSLHEEMLNQLVKVKKLSVISRTSVLPYVGAGRPIGEIARELNVESIMECSVAYADGRVAISAQLIDPRTGVHIWSERYNREFSDVFGIQLDIAVNIAHALQAEFSQDERASVEKRPTKSLEAYALYLQSLSVFPDEAQVFLNQAIALDPNFALAYAARAHNYAQDLLGITGTNPAEAAKFEQIVSEDAERALRLDPTLGRAHAALAAIHYGNWRATAAEEAFARAYELTPDPNLVSEYGRFKRYLGEYDEAIRLQRRAHDLDPNNWNIHYQLGLSYVWGSNFDAAHSLFRELSESDPGNPAEHLQLGRIAVFMGNRQEALQELHLAESLWLGIELNAFRLGQLAIAYSLAGSRDDAARQFDALQAIADEAQVGDGIWAIAYLAMGDKKQALEHLTAAVNERVSTDLPTLSELAINPWNDPVLAEPEFRSLLSGLWDSE